MMMMVVVVAVVVVVVVVAVVVVTRMVTYAPSHERKCARTAHSRPTQDRSQPTNDTTRTKNSRSKVSLLSFTTESSSVLAGVAWMVALGAPGRSKLGLLRRATGVTDKAFR